MTLPNFLIIGAAKAGTTTLHAYLRPHPEIFMPARKELRFFAYGGTGDDYSYPVKTLEEYEGYFAEAGDATAIGEATPRYLRTPAAAGRIKAQIPDCRLVISLRNPVDQSFSAYLMGLRNGSVAPGTSYLAAIAAHPNFLRGYAADLENYFGLFDRAQFHIIRFEDLVRDPLAVAGALYGFLGVATDFTPAVERVANPWRPAEELRAAQHPRQQAGDGLRQALPARAAARGGKRGAQRQPREAAHGSGGARCGDGGAARRHPAHRRSRRAGFLGLAAAARGRNEE